MPAKKLDGKALAAAMRAEVAARVGERARQGRRPPGLAVGRSNIVGKPLAVMMMQKPTPANPAGGDATVTVAHTRTRDLAAVCRRADIVVAAVGVPGAVTPDMVRPGAAVVDVGTTSV